jgi:formate-dependent nitrite reductase cytochrome c552 subunit
MFPHNTMSKLNCLQGHHHIYENGKNVVDESKLEEGNQDIRCSACHSPESPRNLKKAFHDQCMGCHKRYQKENKKTGPQYCGECHVKIKK